MPNKEKCCELVPVTHTFTDECGQFILGPLEADNHFVIKIWHNGVKLRTIPGKHIVCKNTNLEKEVDCEEECDNQNLASSCKIPAYKNIGNNSTEVVTNIGNKTLVHAYFLKDNYCKGCYYEKQIIPRQGNCCSNKTNW